MAHWLRVLDAVGGLVELSNRFRRRPADADALSGVAPGRPGGALEARLAGVLVAALKEAFDRDSARLELERSQVEAERRRAQEALRAELQRQAADRALAHLRLIAVIAVVAWALSAALGAWLPGMRGAAPRALLGAGWAASFAALGCAFAGWRSILTASAFVPDVSTVLPRETSGPTAEGPAMPRRETRTEATDPRGLAREPMTAAAAPWLLLGGLALIATSLLFAL